MNRSVRCTAFVAAAEMLAKPTPDRTHSEPRTTIFQTRRRGEVLECARSPIERKHAIDHRMQLFGLKRAHQGFELLASELNATESRQLGRER
jgi:hypothetical protein